MLSPLIEQWFVRRPQALSSRTQNPSTALWRGAVQLLSLPLPNSLSIVLLNAEHCEGSAPFRLNVIIPRHDLPYEAMTMPSNTSLGEPAL